MCWNMWVGVGCDVWLRRMAAKYVQGGWHVRPLYKKKSLFDIQAEGRKRESAFLSVPPFFDDLVYPLVAEWVVAEGQSKSGSGSGRVVTEYHCPWVRSGEWFPWPQQIRVYCEQKGSVIHVSVISFFLRALWNCAESREFLTESVIASRFKDTCWVGKRANWVKWSAYDATALMGRHQPPLSLSRWN